MNHSSSQQDPYEVLGIDSNASEEEVRQRYLALVKLNPPEKDPAKFREIHQAYESAKDPLVLAQSLLGPPKRMPEWDEVIAQQKKQPPNLSAKLLIALGNRPPTGEANEVTPIKQRDDSDHE